jgi:hypothetical protein
MSRRGSCFGGSSIIHDPAYPRLARKLRKTRQSEKRCAIERERFVAQLAAYEASNRQPVLIKKCGQVVRGTETHEFDEGASAKSSRLNCSVKEKKKFLGSLQDLMHLLTRLGLHGDWNAEPSRVWQFRCPDKAGMHWSESKGTVWFDGPGEAKAALQAKVEPVIVAWTPRECC